MTSTQFRELDFWSQDEQILHVLINGNVGFLMYLREPGDAGFTSRNPAYAGPEDATIEYRLSNGQRDEYPASWALPISVIDEAIAYFKREAKKPPFIHWYDDSLGD